MREIKTVVAIVAISIGTSIITASAVTILGCYSFKIYIEKELARILDEEYEFTKEHVEKVIEMAKDSIKKAYSNK